MRVHYEIPDELHQRAKVAAAQTGVSLKAFLERALDRAATEVEAEQARKPRARRPKAEAPRARRTKGK